MTRLQAKLLRFLPAVLTVVVTASAGAGAVYLLRHFMAQPPPQLKPVVQQVRLIRPPPPPPEVEPPPPEVEQVDVPEPETPDDAPADLPPASELLGLDAEGVAGADGFGLVGNKGGRDLLASGSGGRFAWYSGVLKEDLLAFLSDYKELRARRYDVQLKLWLADDGSVNRVDLQTSTGDEELDRELRMRLASLDRVTEAPPDDLPQPIRLRIVSRL
jgi:protein TonB